MALFMAVTGFAHVHVQSRKKKHIFFCSSMHNHRRAYKSIWTYGVKSSRRWITDRHTTYADFMKKGLLIFDEMRSLHTYDSYVPIHYYKYAFSVWLKLRHETPIWSHIIFTSIFSYKEKIECSLNTYNSYVCYRLIHLIRTIFFLNTLFTFLRNQSELLRVSAKFMVTRIMCIDMWISHANTTIYIDE